MPALEGGQPVGCGSRIGYPYPRPERRLPSGPRMSALWLSGRLAERITEQDPQQLAAAVSDLSVDAVLPPPEHTAEGGAR